MRDIYPRNIDYIDQNYKRIKWIYLDNKDYSPIFIDMIDIDTPLTSGLNFDDNIYGYSVASLDKNIASFRNLDYVENYMKSNKPTGITDEAIDKYFKIYKDYNKK